MKKLKAKTVRARRKTIIAQFDIVSKVADNMLTRARHEYASDMSKLQEACPHENVTSYDGTPYDKGGKSCQDCGKDFNP